MVNIWNMIYKSTTSGSNFLLKVNNSSIGYDLESDDEIELVVGKFNS